MALSPNVLAQAFLEIASNHPANYEEAGKRWAHAYATYAKDALTIPSPTPLPATLTGAEERVMGGVLGAAFAASFLTPQTALAFDNACTAFWFAPPVIFGAGVVTAVGGTGTLASGLPSIWAANVAGRLDSQTCCKLIAAAFHAFTLTVIVTVPNLSGPPFIGPIS
jgi:hypothetical protein